jgi:hypothetical protein
MGQQVAWHVLDPAQYDDCAFQMPRVPQDDF